MPTAEDTAGAKRLRWVAKMWYRGGERGDRDVSIIAGQLFSREEVKEARMAAPDRYDVSIRCGGCDAVAVVAVMENNYPFAKRRGMRIDRVKEGNFGADKTGDATFTVHYNACGTATSWIEN